MSLSSPLPGCSGQPFSVAPNSSGGQGQLQYRWSDGSTDSLLQGIRGTQATTYVLTVTDGCQQTQIDSFTLVNPQISATLNGSFSLCDSLRVSIPVFLSGGTNYTISFTENGMPQTLTSSRDTVFLTYSQVVNLVLTAVSADGCPGQASGSAAVTSGNFSVSADVTNLSCLGDSTGSINVSVNNNSAAFQYYWLDTTLQGFNPTDLRAGIYPLRIVDVAGCFLDTSFTINEPSSLVSLRLDSVSNQDCRQLGYLGVEANGGTAPYSFAWSNGPSGPNNPGLNGGQNYRVLVSDARGCQDSSSYSILDLRRSLQAGIEASALELNCQIRSSTLAAQNNNTPPLAYRWENAEGQLLSTADSMVADRPGLYTLTLSDPSNGCSAQAFFDLGQSEDVLLLDVGGPYQLDCNRESIDLTGRATNYTGALEYRWTDLVGDQLGSAASLLGLSQPGQYILAATRLDNGCSAVDTAVVTINTSAPDVVLQETSRLNCRDTVAGLLASPSQGGNYRFRWQTADGQIQGSDTLANLSYVQAGTYVLQLTDLANGCQSERSMTTSLDQRALVAIAGSDQQLPCGLAPLSHCKAKPAQRLMAPPSVAQLEPKHT
ncbi:MAG: hypothetical protein HC821_01050 [Lewinella sp.]|nr:hypothetical protein [Lewinella sp.]